MVNSEELIGATDYLALQTRYRINRCRYNRVGITNGSGDGLQLEITVLDWHSQIKTRSYNLKRFLEVNFCLRKADVSFISQ